MRVEICAGVALAFAFAGCAGRPDVSGSSPDAGPKTSTAPRYHLTVSVAGSGAVRSAVFPQDCRGVCAAEVAGGTLVHLDAVADAANDFAGWSGACGSASACDVPVSSDVDLAASFAAAQVRVSVVVAGSGMVRSSPAGLECTGTCAATFPAGTRLHLDAIPAEGSALSAFSGDCSGTACDLELSQPRTVTASFVAVIDTLTVRLRGSGHGRVVSTPSGLDCASGSTCTLAVARDSQVRLDASPDAISRLEFWSGACAADPCSFRMHGDTVVDVSFALRRYALVDLGVAPSDWWSSASAMSADGKIVAGNSGGSGRPVLFSPSLQTLGVVWGDAVAVNSQRMVAGNAYVIDPSGAFLQNPFRWVNGAIANLPSLGGTYSLATAMNERGTVAGAASYANGPARAVTWDGSGVTDLGSLGDGGWACSFAYGINDAGTVVGESCTRFGVQHAARFRSPGVIDDLGTLGGNNSRATAINERGDIVGFSDVAQGQGAHGFVVRGATMIDAGTLPGASYSQLRAINDEGVAVGLSYNLNEWPLTAVLYLDGHMVAIDGLVDDVRSFRVDGAAAIGNDGTIVGSAQLFGNDHAVLLRPR